MSKPAALPRTAAGDYLPNAESAAFDAPRVAAIPLAVEPWDVSVWSLSALDGRVSSRLLEESLPGAPAFNRAMCSALIDKAVDLLDCAMYSADYDFHDEVLIQWRAGDWVVLEEGYDIHCGGSPIYGPEYRTWNLAAGKFIDPWTWVMPVSQDAGCSDSGCEQHPPDELNDLILASAGDQPNSECADALEWYRDNGHYMVRPYAGGLIFSTDYSYGLRGCNQDMKIPWAKLAPLLTPEGKRAMQSIRRAHAGVKR